MSEHKNDDDAEKEEELLKDEENIETKGNNEKENEVLVTGVTLSKSRINITFSDMNESNLSSATFKTYKSIPFQSDNLDLDIPNFSPTRFKKSNWKMTHSCCCFLFSIFYGISAVFIYRKDENTYFVLLAFAHIFLIISTLIEWCNFKRGCIGEANLNTKLKKNVDQSMKAKILRSEYGLIYFISCMAALMLFIGDAIHYFSEEIKLSKTDIEIILVYFNVFGMMTLALSQIMKINKILKIDYHVSYVKSDFSKSLFEIIFFFASLLEGGTFMIQLFNINLKLSRLFVFHLIIKIFDSLLFVTSVFILQFNYFLSDYCKFK